MTESIADPFVNGRRHGMIVGNRPLHDFVPLYWATHTPMQYVVTQREARLPQEQLVFFVLDPASVLQLPGVWTTDGNAASSETRMFEGREGLKHLDQTILATPNCFSREYKRKKCAEVLVPGEVPASCIRFVGVCCEDTKNSLLGNVGMVKELVEKSGREYDCPEVIVEPALYYRA